MNMKKIILIKLAYSKQTKCFNLFPTLAMRVGIFFFSCDNFKKFSKIFFENFHFKAYSKTRQKASARIKLLPTTNRLPRNTETTMCFQKVAKV